MSKQSATTDDPADSLEYHQAVSKDGFEIKMLPTWRPDKAMAVENPEAFRSYMEKLGAASDCSISSFTDLLTALRKRQDFFAANGCKLSDHGIETFFATPFYPRRDHDDLQQSVWWQDADS